MKKIKFAMIGLGGISHRFVKGLHLVEDAEILAVCSRNQSKAQAYAKEYDIPYSYDNYEMMLQNSQIDAIYIATPNDTHASLMMLALQHGKHVLCEKPFCVHTKEAKEVFTYAKQQHLLVMEAMKACFLPTTYMVKQWLQDKEIGNIRYIEAGYGSKTEGVSKSHHLYDAKRGGGSFYDVGIYPLAFVNELYPAVIKSVTSQKVMQDGIDATTQVLLQYEDGVLASIRSSIAVDLHNEAILYGDKGSIRIPQFWKSERAYLETKDKKEIFIELHNKTEFQYQIQHFVTLLQQHRQESDIMSECAIIKNMEILEGVSFHE